MTDSLRYCWIQTSVFAVEENIFHVQSSYFLLKTPYLTNIFGQLTHAKNALSDVLNYQ